VVMVVMNKCILPACEGEHYAKGFCEKHYRRWKRGPGHWKGYLDLQQCLFCGGEVYAKGVCRNHYEQWKRGTEGRKLRKRADLYLYTPNKDSDYD